MLKGANLEDEMLVSHVPNENEFTLFFDTNSTWGAMLTAIQRAKTSIQFEQYIFENDACGRQFIELIIEKAKQGVSIFLMCDRFGSASLYHSDYPKKLEQAGGYIHFYNDAAWKHIVKPMRVFPRTHVKMLVVDNQVGFIGGVCLAERMRGWRDTQIQVSGQIAGMMGKLLDGTSHYIKRKKLSRLLNKPKRILGENETMVLLSTPTLFKFTIYKSFYKHVLHAKKSIYISSAFFIPNRKFMNLLKRKAKKGVSVNILVPAQSDVRLADWVFLSYAHTLIKSGIRVFAYQNTVMHAKTMVIDEKWCTIGSANLDVLSFFFNREANLVTEDERICRALLAQNERDLVNSREITLEALAQRSIFIKIMGYTGRLLKLFLIKSKA